MLEWGSATSHWFDLLAGQFSPLSLRALVPRTGERTEEPLGEGVLGLHEWLGSRDKDGDGDWEGPRETAGLADDGGGWMDPSSVA